MRSSASVATIALIVAPVLVACGPTAGEVRGENRRGAVAPSVVTDSTYPAALRAYERLQLDDPIRPELRARIIDYLSRKSAPLVQAGDYDRIVEHFSAMTGLLTPEDFSRNELPRQLESLARAIVERGSPRGDEARVMSALLVLIAFRHGGEDAREYRVLARWGRSARSRLPGPTERFDGLITVWEEHARLTPAPAVLATLANLYIERRNALVRLFGPEMTRLPAPGTMTLEDFRNASVHLRRAPFDVAGVYLSHGDVAAALGRVQQMGGLGQEDRPLIAALRDARDEGSDGSEALVQLVGHYLRRAPRPDVVLALCELGLRRDDADARFPQCLARVSALKGDYAGATAWYAEAVARAPDERELYDEALTVLRDLIEQGRFESDARSARTVANEAEHILAERLRRWPRPAPPVRPEQLHLAIGIAEMSAGNAAEAKRRFEASIAAHENADALVELGNLTERTGHAADAARLYRRALDITPQRGREDGQRRARILESLGEALTESGSATQATRMYQQALELWDASVAGMTGPALAEAQVSRGVLLDRLGRHREAVTAFDLAIVAAPDQFSVYAKILSHLVIATPDVQLAHSVFRRAMRQLTLEPEWKVYFALWVQAIAGRGRTPAEPDVRETLESLATGDTWWARLAKFGIGQLPYSDLLAAASGRGEQTEAHFYEGARLMGQGDMDRARRLFRRVLEMNMVNFFEHEMAQQLVAQGRSP